MPKRHLPEKEKVRFNIYIDKGTLSELNAIAEGENRYVSEVIREVLQKHVHQVQLQKRAK